jgi:hypothetical protein
MAWLACHVPSYLLCIYDMYGVKPLDIVRSIDNEYYRVEVNDLVNFRKASLSIGHWPINGEVIPLMYPIVLCLTSFFSRR